MVGFQGRSTLPALSGNVGSIQGNPHSVFMVERNVVLYWGTRVGIVNTLRVATNVHVTEAGKVDLPKTVIVDKGWWLDVCGTVSTSTDTLIVREGGDLRMSPPAPPLELHTVVIDYQGSMDRSQYCTQSTSPVSLSLTYFNKTAEFSLDTSKFTLTRGTQGTVTPTGAALSKTECASTSDLVLKRNQVCMVMAGKTYSYTAITINPGAEMKVEGSATGTGITSVSADTVDIMFGGKISGVGAGFKSGGPGTASSGGQGATHGGRGVGSMATSYGNIKEPNTYGSNGAGATLTTGRGGGQIKLVVSGALNIDGSIDMSADMGGAGSGGSIWLQAATISGDGYMKAEGNLGGGGGRIAAIASQTFSFTGTASAKGGDDGTGNRGSAGRHQHSLSVSQWYIYVAFDVQLSRDEVFIIYECNFK